MRIFGEFQKVEKKDDGTLIVAGIASSEDMDSDGEIVMAEAMREALPEYMKFGAVREMHQPIAAGTALHAEVSDDGKTYFEALIVDPLACKKVETGVYKGFSIGGKVPPDGRDLENKKIIRRVNLNEISLVDRPANPAAVFTLVKFDSSEGDSMAEHEHIQKGMYEVAWAANIMEELKSLQECVAAEALREGDKSPIPEKIKEAIAQFGEQLKALVSEEVGEMVDVAPAADAVVVEEADKEEESGEVEMSSKIGDLKKGAGKFDKDTTNLLAKVHGMLQECDKCMKMVGYMDDTKEPEKENEDGKEEEKPEKSAKSSLTKIDLLLEKIEKMGKRLEKIESLPMPAKGIAKISAIDRRNDGLQKSFDETRPVSIADEIKLIHRGGGLNSLNSFPR